MLKKVKRKMSLILMLVLISTIFIGCLDSNKPGSKLKEITPVSVTVEGVEFKVGESKLGDIVEGGLLISPDVTTEESIDGLELEKMTYYLAYVKKDGYNLGTINFVNNTKESMAYKDCMISEYEMEFKNVTSGCKNNKFDNILVDGINFNGMTIDDVKSVMSQKTDDVSEINEPDGSIAILTYKVNNVSINISFDYTTKTVSKVDVQVYNAYFE